MLSNRYITRITISRLIPLGLIVSMATLALGPQAQPGIATRRFVHPGLMQNRQDLPGIEIARASDGTVHGNSERHNGQAEQIAIKDSNRVVRSQFDQKDTFLSCDFEDARWWKAWGLKAEPANTALVEGQAAFMGRGKSLKVTIPRGTNTGANFHYRFQQQLGREPEEIYFRYYVKLDPDWKHASDGGKLPGFSGTYGKSGWGGRKVDGTDGWSARGHFKKPGNDATEIGFYGYHADMKGKYGDVFKFTPPLQYDRWYCIEMYCRLNSLGKEGGPGKKDGILQSWIDGKLAYERTDIRFRDVAKLKIESIWVNVYHGGTKIAPEDLHLYLDNIVIARKPIGPVMPPPLSWPAASRSLEVSPRLH